MVKIFNFIQLYYLFGVSNIRKYPAKVDNSDPVKTPILTPSMYCIFSTKAKLPTNKHWQMHISALYQKQHRDLSRVQYLKVKKNLFLFFYVELSLLKVLQLLLHEFQNCE